MKLYELGPEPVVVRCPNIDIPGAKGFTVFESGWFFNRGLRPLRMRCLISEHLAVARVLASGKPRGVFVERWMRREALAICVPRIVAASQRERTAPLTDPNS